MGSNWVNIIRFGGYSSLPLFVAITIILLVYVLIGWVKKWQKFRSQVEKIPGPPVTNFLFGNALQFPSKREGYLDYFATPKEHKVTRYWIGPFPIFLLYTAEAVEEVASGKAYSDRGEEYNFTRSLLGDGIITSTGIKWETRRKMLMPAFNGSILKDFMVIFNDQTQFLLPRLFQQREKTIDVLPFLEEYSFDVICETAMGYRLYIQTSDKNRELFDAMKRYEHIISERVFKPWYRPNWLYRFSSYAREDKKICRLIHSYPRKVLNELKLEPNINKNPNNCDNKDDKKNRSFLHRLYHISENGKYLSDEDILTEVATFLTVGYHTTSLALSWFFQFVGAFPHIQQRINEELDEVFGGSDRPVEMSDIPRLKYLECCILETLRLRPSLSMMGRKLSQDITIHDYVLPAGTTAVICSYLLHRNPEYYPNPEQFIPERFLPEEQAKRSPYCYTGFSVGPRSCIGRKYGLLESMVVGATVLRKFRVESDGTDLSPYFVLMSKPFNGFKVRFIPKSSVVQPTE